MNKCENNTHDKETVRLPIYLRIKDRQRHFLGEVRKLPGGGYLISIYCKKCKESLEIPINQLVNSIS